MIRLPRRAGGDRARARTVIVMALTLVLATVFALRLADLQLVNGESNRRAAQKLTTRTVIVPAQRGRILASDGSVLVGNGATTTLTMDPVTLAKQRDGGAGVLTRVANALGVPAERVEERVKPCGTRGSAPSPICFSGAPFEPIPLASDVPMDKALAIVERPEAYPGVATTQSATRTYPIGGDSIAHVVGYLTRPVGQELDAPGVGASTLIGRDGLEEQYNTQLSGTAGQQVIALGPDGLARDVIRRSAPKAGADVRTSLDPSVQKAAAKALADGIAAARKAKMLADSGSAVVIDAANGQVVALANAPTYNPDVWNGGITESEYAGLNATSANAPLTNRAAAVAGPPASTFKAFSLFAAARDGVDPHGKYFCPASVNIGNRTFTNFESQAHGTIDIPTILGVSCDTVFYRWAYDQYRKVGGPQAPISAPDPFVSVASEFGFGTRSGVDLPDDVKGVVPSRSTIKAAFERDKNRICTRAKNGYPEVKNRANAAYLQQIAKENCANGGVMRPGDAVNFAIGQGDVGVTPIQLAAAYAALINGGTLYEPRLAQAIVDSSGKVITQIKAPVKAHVALDPAMLAQELAGFKQATTSGTASAAFSSFDLAAYPVSGKTGTAEVYGKQATAWFASFGPKRNGHQYVVVVRVSQGGEGGRVAAPIARAIWDVLKDR